MIQYYLDLLKQVQDFNAKCGQGAQIQKIYTTINYISISLRVPGKTWHLYLGRGAGNEGIWTHHSSPPSDLRRKDIFLDYLRSHLIASTLLTLKTDHSDRIIKLDYQKFGATNSLLFFWKGRKLFFVHFFRNADEHNFKLLLSWRGKTIDVSDAQIDLYDLFNEVGRVTDTVQYMESKEIMSMENLLLNALEQIKKQQVTHDKFNSRKRKNILNDLAKTREWRELDLFLKSEASLDGLDEITLGSHRISFEGGINEFKKRDLIFEKIKKLKRGEKILQERLDQTEKLSKEISKKISPSKQPRSSVVSPAWRREGLKDQPLQTNTKTEEYKIFYFEKLNLSIGVGLTSQGNDQLRSRWANSLDTWLHLDGIKSAHVVIKLKDNTQLTPDILNLSASILAFFSGFKADWIPIVYTQVKNLRGVSGCPGMVTYKKEKRLNCPQRSLKEINCEYP